MKEIVKVEDLSEGLDVSELMEVKGGCTDVHNVCIFTAAVKCTVEGAGVIVKPEEAGGHYYRRP